MRSIILSEMSSGENESVLIKEFFERLLFKSAQNNLNFSITLETETQNTFY